MVRSTDCPPMTIAVDLDVKQQNKQTKYFYICISNYSIFQYLAYFQHLSNGKNKLVNNLICLSYKHYFFLFTTIIIFMVYE